MVSLKNIAAECGVSVATVSKALNDHSDIGSETKERIRTKAKEMGYLPNFAAQALKTNRTYNIGVLFADQALSGLTHDYYSHVLDSFKRAAESRGYDITFINHTGVGGAGRSYLEHVRYRRFDGVLIACIDYKDKQVVELVNSDVPLAAIDYSYEGRIAILSDNIKGMTELTRYICNCGHRKIAYIHGEDVSAVTNSRLTTFKKVMEEHGIEVPDEYIKGISYRSTQGAYDYTMELLDLEDRPTCIIYSDDFASLGGISAIRQRGLSIPEDISIAGYDGIPISSLMVPKLTTVKQDTEELGKRAANNLIALIEEPRTAVIGISHIPGQLVQGDSVKKIN